MGTCFQVFIMYVLGYFVSIFELHLVSQENTFAIGFCIINQIKVAKLHAYRKAWCHCGLLLIQF